VDDTARPRRRDDDGGLVSGAEIAEIVGRALIAYLFVWTGIYNWSQPDRVQFNIRHLAGRGVPYPSFVLYTAFVWQIVAAPPCFSVST